MAIGGFFGAGEWAAQRSLAVALLLALLPGVAEAQSGSRACRQLEAQLSAASSGGRAAPAQIRSYDDAIKRQQDHMARTRAQARQAGCGVAIFGRSVARCGELNATLARMETNLAQLQKKHARLGASANSGRERARIMAALDAKGCRASRQPSQVEIKGDTVASSQAARAGGLSGDFRTLCVRSCDGYYFPVSWSAPQNAFERDGKTCQALCPGTQVELHYHRTSGEEAEDMVSVATGTPYRDSENAFLYRRPGASIPAGCGCGATAQAASGFETIGGEYASNDPGVSIDQPADGDLVTAAIPQPRGRPDPAEDPETLATREGGLDAAGLRRLATPPSASAAASPAQRQIRRVGPTFFPD